MKQYTLGTPSRTTNGRGPLVGLLLLELFAFGLFARLSASEAHVVEPPGERTPTAACLPGSLSPDDAHGCGAPVIDDPDDGSCEHARRGRNAVGARATEPVDPTRTRASHLEVPQAAQALESGREQTPLGGTPCPFPITRRTSGATS